MPLAKAVHAIHTVEAALQPGGAGLLGSNDEEQSHGVLFSPMPVNWRFYSRRRGHLRNRAASVNPADIQREELCGADFGGQEGQQLDPQPP